MAALLGVGLVILLGLHVTYSSQCDCNDSCAIYTSPVQCVRCCTHYVKRSLPLHAAAAAAAHHRKRQFLTESHHGSRRKSPPVWRKHSDGSEQSLQRLVRLLLRTAV